MRGPAREENERLLRTYLLGENENGEAQAVFDAQLLKYSAQVSFDGIFGDLQAACDFFIPVPAGN